MNLYVTIILICLNYNCFSQNINFTDLELKRYLINEKCVDTTNTGPFSFFSNDIDVDLNNDNEIQLSEAQDVFRLKLTGNNYPFKSIQDLSQFQNLNYLNLISCDSITEFSNLVSTSIKSLIIGQCRTLKIIDISGLTGLSDILRVEDMDQTLTYVNTQNGITPQLYSFFYTDHIDYACIDDDAKEYNEIEWKMISGTPTINNCAVLNTTNNIIEFQEPIEIFPNPINAVFEINSNHPFEKVKIYDINGLQLENFTINGNKINISNLSSGIYFLAIELSGRIIIEKIIKM
ncbi:MAG: T9SS type A sorting domain-containing protein [Saprospiraceae bacterium]